MLLRQIVDPHLAQNAYLIGCQRSGEAIVIDPQRDIATYRALAQEEGLRLTAVAETHIHADFVSGAAELAADPAVSVYVSAEGGADWQSEWAAGKSNLHPLHDGDRFTIGQIEFETLHTPGHTPEHICFLVTDRGGGASEPMALVSGDFLFVGDVGRPDLLEQAVGQSGTQEAGARHLFASLQKVTALADYVQVLPGHGAGSACGKALGAIPSSTIGYEKRYNRALGLALGGKERAFVDYILEGQPEPPLYFANMKVLNRGGAPLLGGSDRLPPELNLSEVIAHLDEPDYVPLDTRSDRPAFAKAHLRGSLFAPELGDFTGFAGSFLRPQDRVLLVVETPAEVLRLSGLLARIGFDGVVGWLPSAALAGAREPQVQSVPLVSFGDLERLLDAIPEAIVLDVRRAGEYARRHVRGARNIAHTRLSARAGELAGDGPIVVHCQTGKRAGAASAYLQRAGRSVFWVDDDFENAPPALLT